MFFIENFKFYFKSWMFQMMSCMMKHVSKAGKVDPGDRVTLPVKFCLQTPAIFNPLSRVTLAQG